MQALDGLGRWLADRAPHHELGELFSGFCRDIVGRGLPIWRASLSLEVLHPELGGWLHVWTDEALTIRESARAGIAQSPAYLNSPVKIVDETDATFRRRLDAPCPDMPLLEELRLLGATDYVIFPLPFLDRTRTAAMAFATQQENGFEPKELDALEMAARLFSPYAERHVLRRIAIDLLDTYVGPRTGSRIIEGRVERGEVEQIEAAIWFTDLRGFTSFSEEAAITEVVSTLNAWFEAMGVVIEEHGGEILKFIGDAVLAIFPSAEQGREAACRQALAAAEEFCHRTDAINVERATQGHAPLAFGFALHFGEVAYGNVGAPRRLDFTVIGPAVNRASRLQELAKQLDRRLVLSRAFARALDQPLVDLGCHELRDVPQPQQVFTLP
jgi:adenylate cyclase